MAKATSRELPLRALQSKLLRAGNRASQAQVDRGRSSKERVAAGGAVGLQRPQHRAVRALPCKNEVNRTSHHRPHRSKETSIFGMQVVKPHAGCHISAHIRVLAVILDPRFEVVVIPGAIWQLSRCKPLEGTLGFDTVSRDKQCHRGFNMVPRIAVTAGEPGDHTVL